MFQRVALIRDENIVEIQVLRPVALNEILTLCYGTEDGQHVAKRFHFHKKYANGVVFKEIFDGVTRLVDPDELF